MTSTGEEPFFSDLALARRLERAEAQSNALFAKARPGFMRFHGDRRPGVSVDGTTRFLLVASGVLEFYPSGRSIVRIDVGDSIISLLEGAVLISRAQGGTKHFKSIARQLMTLLGA